MPEDKRLHFYRSHLGQWIDDPDASLLVVAGGPNDRDVCSALGLSDVVICNLDERLDEGAIAPYRWSHQNAEALQYDDNSFDYVVVHAALHHCSSPHRALSEMYRVARRAVIVFESRDSMVMRFIERLGLTSRYETTAVFYNGGRHGGVNNGEIPNFVYRWSEREIEKTIAAYAPHLRHRFSYRYDHDLPRLAGRLRRGGARALLTALATPAYRLFARLFPRQQNLFACRIDKPQLPQDLQPWIVLDEVGRPRFDMTWAEATYRKLN